MWVLLACSVEVTPRSYDFGSLWIGCTDSVPVDLFNAGNADLVIEALPWITADDSLTFDVDEATNGPLPWTIPSGTSLTTTASFTPSLALEASATLAVSSSDPSSPTYEADFHGTGVAYDSATDTYTQADAQATFLLTQPPAPETLSVSVDGLATDAWSYDADRQAVVFEVAPEAGTTITLAYVVLGPCG
jgi:hypothetical protein